jgi:hypothetical protein
VIEAYRGVDGLPGAGEDIPQQEEQDADGQGVEERLDPGHLSPQAAQRQTEEDRETRKGPEDGDLACGHEKVPFPGVSAALHSSVRPARQ